MLRVRYESLHRCLNLFCCRLIFFCRSVFLFLLFQRRGETVSPQLCLGFSSQRTSLHCTIIDATLYTTSGQEMQVCLSTQKHRRDCRVTLPTVKFTSNFFFFLKFASGVLI